MTAENAPVPSQLDLSPWVSVDACTLPTAQQPLRLAEFHDLFATALRDIDRRSATHLRLTVDPAAETTARDLAARESSCCSFFSFTFTPAPDGLHMDVVVPPERSDVLDGLTAQATEARRS
ncbi:hypothetical protein [Nocardia sp. NPDC050406]|uniref:hypothetical protein n=1 Tax=Nocardia sp. NPDC050406 TaxID=3364318 RepID=UPI0037BE1735